MTTGSISSLVPRDHFFMLPVLVTLSIHSFLGFILTTNWTLFETQDWEIVSQPKVIEAQLVRIDNRDDLPPKQVEKIKPASLAPILPKKKVAEVSESRRTKPREIVEEESIEVENDTKDHADLMTLLVEEERVFKTQEESVISTSYATAIQRKVIRYWSRPPSARNGMECLIAIQLVPTGEVVASSILKSSGSTAFDLSALNAVKKAGSFSELKKLSSTEFERNFRRFRLLFRPDDLRY